MCGHMVAGGRRWSCRSCCCMCRMFFLLLSLAVASKSCRVCLGPSTNRIASNQPGSMSSRFDCRCRIRRDVGVLCPVAVCCAVSRLPAWENIPSTNPAARQGSLCRNSPAQREPSQPPAHLIDSPATRIATRHRDRFFLGCVIHAGSRGWYLPHDGNNMRRKQTLGRWLAGAGLEWLAGCLTAKCSCYWAVIVTV